MALFTLDHGGGVMSTHEDGSSLPVDQPAPERGRPAAVPAAKLPCIGNDPFCPCQDGDACHYRGNSAFPIPFAALIRAIVALMKVQNVRILQIRSDGQIKGDDSPWHFPE